MSLPELNASLETVLAKYREQRPLEEAERQRHIEHLRTLIARQEALNARLQREDWETTVAQVRRMVDRPTHPTWVHAAYADLAGRLARVEDRLEALEDSLGLLHTKVETIIGQLLADERQDTGRDACELRSVDARTPDTRVVTAPAAASILECTTRNLRRLAAAGALPGWHDADGRWQFRLVDVLAYKRHRAPVPREP
jgi:hypothetical protein